MVTAARVTRAERSRDAHRLREEGLTHAQIAARMGVSRGYVRDLFYDPDGSKVEVRRESYRGRCEVCGGKTTGCNGPGSAPKRCKQCSLPQAYWTPERIIHAIQRFARENGRPPKSYEWLMGKHGINGDGYPYVSEIQRVFGSWANAIEAAGFPRPPIGGYIRTPEQRAKQIARLIAARPGPTWTREEIVEAIRRWVSEHGRAPSSQDWRHANGEHPTDQTVRRLFGSWHEGLAAAGVQSLRGGPRRGGWR